MRRSDEPLMRFLIVGLCVMSTSCTRAAPPFVWDAECDRQAASGSWVLDLDAVRIRLGQRRRCPDGDQPCVAGDEGRQRAFLWDSSFASHDGGFVSAMTGVKTQNGAVRMNLLVSGSIAHIVLAPGSVSWRAISEMAQSEASWSTFDGAVRTAALPMISTPPASRIEFSAEGVRLGPELGLAFPDWGGDRAARYPNDERVDLLARSKFFLVDAAGNAVACGVF